MQKLSDATGIVSRMLVTYFRASADERDALSGAEEAKKAWGLVHQQLEATDMVFLADEFEKNPDQMQQKLVNELTKCMYNDPRFSDEVQRLYDEYLRKMYARMNVEVEQNFGHISNVAGATKGGTVVGIKIDELK
jgi:hypothetical protein